MRKFLAVPAIILVLSFFVTSVQATVPVVADLPDMAFLTGSSGSESGGDMFDLDGYVDDFDDADADLSWTDPVATSGITPVVNVNASTHVASSGFNTLKEAGAAEYEVSDGAATATGQSGMKWSDFRFTQPSLTKDGFVTGVAAGDILSLYTTYGTQAINTPNLDGKISGSAPGTINWYVYARDAIVKDATFGSQANKGVGTLVCQPTATSGAYANLTVAIDANGALTLTPGSSFNTPVELGVKAVDASDSNNFATARIWVAPDIPQKTGSTDPLVAHAFDGACPTGPIPQAVATTHGVWNEDTSAWSTNTIRPDVNAPSGAPASFAGGPSGNALIFSMPDAFGVGRVWCLPFDVEANQEYVAECWVASDTAGSADYSIYLVLINSTDPADNPVWDQAWFYNQPDVADVAGIPGSGDGWKKVSVRCKTGPGTAADTQTSMQLVIQIVSNAGSGTGETIWVDNVAIYKDATLNAEWNSPVLTEHGKTLVKMPVDITGVTEDIEGADLTAVGLKQIELDNSPGVSFGVVNTANHTNVDSASRAVQFNFTTSSYARVRLQDAADCATGLTNLSPSGAGLYELSCWVKVTGSAPEGEFVLAALMYHGAGSVSTPAPPDQICYGQRDINLLKASENEGWVKYSVFLPAAIAFSGIDLVIDCANINLLTMAAAQATVLMDDIALSQVIDAAKYWDDSIFP